MFDSEPEIKQTEPIDVDVIDVVIDESDSYQTESEMHIVYIVLVVLLLGVSICKGVLYCLNVDFIMINVIPLNGKSSNYVEYNSQNPIDVSSVNVCEESCL